MSVKHSGYSTTIIHTGRFELNSFYSHIYETVTGNGYLLVDESHTQKNKGAADKLEVIFGFEKLVDDYTKFTIKISIIASSLKHVIVKKNGVEKKLVEGKIKISISGDIITDYLNNWEKSKFLEFLRSFYEKYLFVGTLNKYDGEIYSEVFSIAGDIKSFFNEPHFL